MLTHLQTIYGWLAKWKMLRYRHTGKWEQDCIQTWKCKMQTKRVKKRHKKGIEESFFLGACRLLYSPLPYKTHTHTDNIPWKTVHKTKNEPTEWVIRRFRFLVLVYAFYFIDFHFIWSCCIHSFVINSLLAQNIFPL